MANDNSKKNNESFIEFLRLCDSDAERALFEAAKSVIGNFAKESDLEYDKKHKDWAGPHGLHNLGLAVEAYMKKKKIK